MNEREKLPVVIAAQAVAVLSEQRGSLVGRGLIALRKDNDALYRQVRNVFGGNDGRNWNANDNSTFASVFKIFLQLASENFGKAYYPLARLYGDKRYIEDTQNHAQYFAHLAFDWCIANQSNQDAELWCDLGEMYEKGCGVSQDYMQAVYWFTKAANLGCGDAQCNFGSMYKDGCGVSQNDEQAAYWYRKAAEQGHTLSKLYLADRREEERILLEEYCQFGKKSCDSRNYEQAISWFRKAAERGHFESQLFLAEMYEDGRGIKDDEQAVYWFRKVLETFPDSGDAQGGLKRLGIDWKR